MEIITYVQPEKIAVKKYTRTASHFEDEINFRKDSKAKKKAEKIDFTFGNYTHIRDIKIEQQPEPKYLSKIKLFILVFSVIVLVATLIGITNFTTSKLDQFQFTKSVEVTVAMKNYLFPEIVATTNSIAEVPDFIQAVEFQNYTVGKGDTISEIAYRFGLRNIGTILAVNEISNAKRLRPGQTLIIPSLDGLFHTVKSGESLSTIATKYELPLTSILDSNDLADTVVQPGEKIFIPGASMNSFTLRKAMGELFIYPIHGRLTSPFGYRRDPFTGAKSFHTGIDLAAKQGTAVKCVLDGRVAEIGYSRIYGNYVIVIHDGGYQSFYGHLSKVYVNRHQYLTQGSRLGAVGNTGRSTGPHLHLSIYKNGKLINPLSVLEK